MAQPVPVAPQVPQYTPPAQKRRVPVPLAGDVPTQAELDILRGCERRSAIAWIAGTSIGGAYGWYSTRNVIPDNKAYSRKAAVFAMGVLGGAIAIIAGSQFCFKQLNEGPVKEFNDQLRASQARPKST